MLSHYYCFPRLESELNKLKFSSLNNWSNYPQQRRKKDLATSKNNKATSTKFQIHMFVESQHVIIQT
jgi:hypothetical protein